MKVLFLLFLISTIAISEDYKAPYEQPMTPQNQNNFDLNPRKGGEINLNSITNINGSLTTEGKTTLKDSLTVKGATKLDGEFKFIPKSGIPHVSIKDWYEDSYALKNRIENDSILGSIKGKNGLKNQITSLAIEVKNDFANYDLKPYIDFKYKKSLIGKFEGVSTGVEINPIQAMNHFDEFSGDISVPANKDVYFLANMKKGDVINRVLIDGRSPEQGRKLTIFNNNAAHIGFKIGEGDGSIAPKVGGVAQGGTLYIEPTESFTFVYSGSWWVRIGGYSGVRADPANGDNLIREINRTCTEGIHCLSTCPKGERLIGSYCSLLDDNNALEASGSYWTRGTWRGQCRTKHPTTKGIHLTITCEKFRYPD